MNFQFMHSNPIKATSFLRSFTMAATVTSCVFALLTLNAQASEQLALAKGCYTCHGTPPKKNAPTFAQLAANYAKYQGQPDAATRLASKLHEGYVFGGVDAHQRLTDENALTLVRWIIAGAK